MGKVIDISTRLNMDVRPVLKFGSHELTVNADASSTLKIFELSKKRDAGEITDMDLTLEGLKVLFGEETATELQKELLFSDLGILSRIAMNLATGKNPYDGLEETEAEEDGNFPG